MWIRKCKFSLKYIIKTLLIIICIKTNTKYPTEVVIGIQNTEECRVGTIAGWFPSSCTSCVALLLCT